MIINYSLFAPFINWSFTDQVVELSRQVDFLFDGGICSIRKECSPNCELNFERCFLSTITILTKLYSLYILFVNAEKSITWNRSFFVGICFSNEYRKHVENTLQILLSLVRSD